MIIIIYILIIAILIFVCFIGIKAKQLNKKNTKKNQDKGTNITKELFELNKLYKTKAISKNEYQKAKTKILKN